MLPQSNFSNALHNQNLLSGKVIKHLSSALSKITLHRNVKARVISCNCNRIDNSQLENLLVTEQLWIRALYLSKGSGF